MNINTKSILGSALCAAGALFAFAQHPAMSATPAIYTASQAAQGAKVFQANCAVCHGAKLEGGVGPALSGASFATTAAGQNLTEKSLYDRTSTTMPSSAPGSLKQNEYEAVVAFLLQSNGFKPGDTALAKDDPALDRVKIAHGETTASSVRPASSGVYTAAQASHGKILYAANCVMCHGGDLGGVEGTPPLAGKSFMAKWGGQPVGNLHTFIEKNMPPGNGGQLGASGDADVVAYVLATNGFPEGSTPLPADPAGISAILLDKAPARQAAPRVATASRGTAAAAGQESTEHKDPVTDGVVYVRPTHITPPSLGPTPGQQPGGSTNTAHAVDNFVPVTDETLRKPNPNDWLMSRGNYEGWGYSTLKQVDRTNVKGLQLVWARLMEPGINEATPLIYNGIMYLPNPNDVIQAIDAVSGELLWQYRRRLPSLEEMHNNSWGQRKRTIFLWHDKIYTTTRDNYLVALDAKTGKEVWQVDRGGDLYVTNTAGPIVVDGVVIAGSNCQEAPFTCFVDGHDAETGKQLWHNGLIPKPGEPGDETWAKKPFDERWGTDVWGPMIYDTQLNLLHYGSSGVMPSSEKEREMPGATMAGTDTRWAVDPKTGKVAWKRQVLPEDGWDQDCTFEMMPITTTVDPDPNAVGMLGIGKDVGAKSRRTLVGAPCKNAIMWSLDAKDGKFLWAKATGVQNIVKSVDSTGKVTINPDVIMNDYNKTYHICPNLSGGRNWNFSAYSPETNAMYVRMQNVCVDLHVRADNIDTYKPADQYNIIGRRKTADGMKSGGRIDAVDVATGKTLWTWDTEASNYSPILATAGGLLFNGGEDRYFRAIDQTTGKALWQTRLGTQVVGTPVTFSVGGRQYISVAAGGPGGPTLGRDSLDQPAGANMVYVFALPE